MLKNTTYADAMTAGYRVSKPNRPTRQLKELCDRLGPEYHIATVDDCNVIHRVIGYGWDVEIWPRRSGSRYYNITLWKGYGRQIVATETDVKDMDDAIMCMVEMMLHTTAPEEVYPTRYPLGPRPHINN